MKIILVQWNDAFALSDDSWYSMADVDDMIANDQRGELCTTIGYLLRDAEHHLIIAHTCQPKLSSKSDAGFSGIFFIPKGMIVDVKELNG